MRSPAQRLLVMTRPVAVLAIAVLAIAGAAGPVGGTPATDAATAPQLAEEPASNASAPGAMLSGVVDVQEAEVGGELAKRSFALRIASAESNASRVSVVAGEVESLRERLTELEQRRDRVQTAHENGTISEARYRAETAALVARSRIMERQLNRTGRVATALPAELLAERNVNPEEIDRLRTGARNLSGPEVAAIARAIAGPTVGSELSDRDDDERGPPGFVGGPTDEEVPDTEDRPGLPDDARGDRPNGTDRGPIEVPNGTESPGDGPLDDGLPGDDDNGRGNSDDADGGEGRER